MIERTYNPVTGLPVTRAVAPPADMPAPDANRPAGSFKDEWYGQWNPSDAPVDPHDVGYTVGEGGTPDAAPVPDNIRGYTPDGDVDFGDPHDTPYDDGDDSGNPDDGDDDDVEVDCGPQLRGHSATGIHGGGPGPFSRSKLL